MEPVSLAPLNFSLPATDLKVADIRRAIQRHTYVTLRSLLPPFKLFNTRKSLDTLIAGKRNSDENQHRIKISLLLQTLKGIKEAHFTVENKFSRVLK